MISACVLVPFAHWTRSYPPATAIYVGLLATPLALVEARLSRPPLVSGFWVIPAWFAVFIAIALAHFQAVYAIGVVEAGSVDGGMIALESAFGRLWRLAPGDAGHSLGLRGVEVDALAGAGVAGPYVASLFVRNGDSFRWLGVLSAVLVTGTLSLTTLTALNDSSMIFAVPIVAFMLAIHSIPGAIAIFVASFATAPLLRATTRPSVPS